MTRERGFSILELLIATAVFVTVSGAVLGLLQAGVTGTPVLEETTDLHQRARVVADVLTGDLRLAAAGTPSGPLSRLFAAVEPRRPADPPGSASSAALTVRYVPPRGAHSRLVQPLAPGVPVAIIDSLSGCPAGTTACGFVAATTALVFDSTGSASVVRIDAIGPGALTISDPAGARVTSYPAGAEITEAVEVSYFFDAAARQLRRAEGGGVFVVADNVTALRFEYFAGGMVPLPLAIFEDGPFSGAGAMAFDLDLLRVRVVRPTLRVETGVDAMRGVDPRFFARPGTATGHRVIRDLVTRFDVSLRNGGT